VSEGEWKKDADFTHGERKKKKVWIPAHCNEEEGGVFDEKKGNSFPRRTGWVEWGKDLEKKIKREGAIPIPRRGRRFHQDK